MYVGKCAGLDGVFSKMLITEEARDGFKSSMLMMIVVGVIFFAAKWDLGMCEMSRSSCFSS